MKKTNKKVKAECYICGNTNKNELELVPLFTDEDGNEKEKTVYMCKENAKGGCN